MNLAKLNLNLLVALDALLVEQNVTRAAERIFLTQSTLSNALHQLRDIFKDELLVRNGNQMSLTPLATALMPKVQQTLKQISELVNNKEFDATHATRTFTIAMTEYSDLRLLPLLYQKIKQLAPEIRLNIKHMPLFSHNDLLENNELDLVIGLVKAPITSPYEILFSEPMICASRRKHSFLKSNLTLNHYLEAEHLAFTIHKAEEPYITDEVLASMGLKRNIVLYVPHIMPALYTVENSDLLVTLPKGIM